MFPEHYASQLIENQNQEKTNQLHEAVGNNIYSWWNDQKSGVKKLSLRSHLNGSADFYLMKSIYHSETLSHVAPSFIIHSGCNFTSQPGFDINTALFTTEKCKMQTPYTLWQSYNNYW